MANDLSPVNPTAWREGSDIDRFGGHFLGGHRLALSLPLVQFMFELGCPIEPEPGQVKENQSCQRNQGFDRTVGTGCRKCRFGLSWRFISFDKGFCLGSFLGGFHGSEVALQEDVQEHESDHQQAVEAKAQGVEEHAVAAFVDPERAANLAKKPHFESDPCANHGKTGDRGTGGVDEKRQLLPADSKSIRDRLHHRADDDGIGVVVDETEDAHQGRRGLGGSASFDPPQEPDDNSSKAPRGDEDLDHHEDQRDKRQDLEIGYVSDRGRDVCDGCFETFQPCSQGQRFGWDMAEQPTGQDGQAQTRQDMTGQERQGNRQQGRDDAVPESLCLRFLAVAQIRRQDTDDDEGYCGHYDFGAFADLQECSSFMVILKVVDSLIKLSYCPGRSGRIKSKHLFNNNFMSISRYGC